MYSDEIYCFYRKREGGGGSFFHCRFHYYYCIWHLCFVESRCGSRIWSRGSQLPGPQNLWLGGPGPRPPGSAPGKYYPSKPFKNPDTKVKEAMYLNKCFMLLNFCASHEYTRMQCLGAMISCLSAAMFLSNFLFFVERSNVSLKMFYFSQFLCLSRVHKDAMSGCDDNV